MLVEPVWKRIGLLKPPDEDSGRGIGIIIFDEIVSHSSIQHLDGRLVQVNVDNDLNVHCLDVLQEPPVKKVKRHLEHGLMILNLLAHQPFEYDNQLYTGLAPSAYFIYFYEEEPKKRKIGLQWILQQDWNVKICLNLLVPQERGWMSPTEQDPNVQAMQPILDAGVLVIAAGGNSRVHNNLHPKKYFVIGGYNDKGLSDSKNYAIHPSVSTGLNGDGHWRPDLLAPYTYLPLPSLTGQGLDFFAGTCGTSTVVTGLVAYLCSIMPKVTSNEIRNLLTETGAILEGFPAPIINGDRAVHRLAKRDLSNEPISFDPLIKVTNEDQSILSINPLERALALTSLIKKGKKIREEIWEFTRDESPMVKKVAIHGLGSPINDREREKYWKQLHEESSDFGVKEDWAYTLLETSTKEELHKWMDFAPDNSIDIQICIHSFLREFYPDAPKVEPSPDPNPEVVKFFYTPILEWYKSR
ncbi:hypothetical protein MK805_14100 [Shimazuella sp. AN120528]|uniref:S8 family serine peptidase n=1 Tax=Shimazuella soli TaxID=1892854 RepID=UPI001F0F8ABE|nr:S8 family serine peptidase [Shimazuella soli]MCH5586070.1 hypothetical protein [Shimazuella soli]